MKISMKRAILWGCIVLWMMVIFSFSSQNAEISGKLSEGLSRRVVLWLLPDRTEDSTVDFLEHIIRKCAHLTEYAVLGVLISVQIRLYGCFHGQWRKIFLAVFFVCIYASTDEVHQLFVGGRSGQITDVCIDTIGGFLGAVFVAVICLLREKKQLKQM